MTAWMPEEWKDVPGWNGAYQVSSWGRIRQGERLIGQFHNDQGYLLARLARPRKLVRVHRLVAEAFVPNPHRKPFVNHLDCMRSNNVAANLEWCTQAENIAYADGLRRMRRDYWAGKRSPNACLSEDDVRKIRNLYAAGGLSMRDVGRIFCVSKRAIGRIVNKETYRDV